MKHKKGIGHMAWIGWVMIFCMKIAGAVLPAPTVGPHQVVNAGQTVQLGDASVDASNLSYYWNFGWLPAGSLAILSDATSPLPTFVPDLPGTYLLQVNATDGIQTSETALVSVTVLDTPLTPYQFDHGPTLAVCVSCHNNVMAPGKPVSHAVTSNLCEACHAPTGWIPMVLVDHKQVLGSCISCHNGVTASGKSPLHIASTDACDACHQPFPGRWVPVALVFHTEVIGSCISCHNGNNASGKPPSHINSSTACDACHQSFPGRWVPVANAAVDHSQVIGVCSSCHNGVVATGKVTTHIATVEECSVCHTVNNWVAATATIHTPVTQRCSKCHNGSNASGKPATHRKTKADCGRCHTVVSWVGTKRRD